MNGNPTITAAIITLNEEPNLWELLPVLDWVDGKDNTAIGTSD